MNSRGYWVYIMGSAGEPIYVGFINNLMRRVWEHKFTHGCQFTAKYNLRKLLFYVEFPTAIEGIAFEKQLKRWRRSRKDELIAEMNPERVDLAAGWYENGMPRSAPPPGSSS